MADYSPRVEDLPLLYINILYSTNGCHYYWVIFKSSFFRAKRWSIETYLGEKTSYKQGILCKGSKSKCRQYDSSIDSSILSDFMQGTYRALHVCTPEKLNIYSRRGRLEQAFDFSAVVSVTDILNHQYNGVLRGMLKDEIECKQLIYNEEVWEFRNWTCSWMLTNWMLDLP